MAVQTINMRLPDALYQRVARRAQRMHISIEDELMALIASSLGDAESLPAETVDTMTQMNFLNDNELWQAARIRVTPNENERMEALTFKRQTEGLTQTEQAETERLIRRFEHVMLVRAQAAALLRQRGNDVSSLLQPPASS